MVSIQKRPNGRWRARFTDPSGTERSRSFARRVDAQQFLDRQAGDMARGEWVDWRKGRMTVGDYAEQWLAVQVHHRPSTATVTRSRLENHILPAFGGRPLAAVDRSEVRAWVAALELSPRTVEAVYRLLAQLFLSAVEDRYLASTPCRKIPLPQPETRGELVPMTVDQVRTVAEAMPPDLEVGVWLAAGAGLRVGEVVGLTVDRVDFLRRTIRVDRQLATARPLGFGPPKTKASSATVPVGSTVTDAIAQHLSVHGEGPDRLVIHRNGFPFHRARLSRAWAAARGETTSARFHDLRHVYASVLIAAGLSPKAVQARMRHATMSETWDTYGHMWPSDDDDTREAIDTAFAL